MNLFESEKCRASHAFPRYVRTHINARGEIAREAWCRHCQEYVPVELIGGAVWRIAPHKHKEDAVV